MLVVMDLESDTIVWALRGSWRRQHDAKMLPNGHILLFDNEGGLMKHGRSRVLEIDPRTAGIVWSFCGTDSNPLDSEIRGGAQRLIGGNTLISESTAGRILEVTPDGSTVWEYVNPLVAVENGHKLIASLGLTVTRYDPTYVSFLDGRRAGGSLKTLCNARRAETSDKRSSLQKLCERGDKRSLGEDCQLYYRGRV